MANESINLNLIPKGEMPVIHVSQFDNGRQFTINLLKGSDEYTLPQGYTAVLNCKKADRNIVTLATTSVLSNALTFTTTTQLCACAGKNLCEVVIKDTEDYQVGTLNFILEVERDPLQGGIDSTSEIHDLEDQIEDITTEIISENYYTKTETDTLLDAKADASDLATVATTGSYTDLNSLPKLNGMTITGNRNAQWYGLASKLNDLSDVTLSSELSEFEILIYNSYLNKWINSKMSYTWLIDKPSIPDAQVQSDYAQSDNTKVDYIKNKPDINGMIEQAIYDIMPIASVSSAPVASFNTEIAAPLQEIKCNITATQSGEGTPSPSNPIPIIGYTEANIVNTQNESIVDLFSIDSDFRGTVAFNQLIQNGNFVDSSNWETSNSNFTVNNNEAIVTATGAWAQIINPSRAFIANHIYLFLFTAKSNNNINLGIGNSVLDYEFNNLTNNFVDYSRIVKPNANTTGTVVLLSRNATNGDSWIVKNVMQIDLTQMFGSTIADYIYSLEQNNAGAGVEFFRSIYPDSYYPYDIGTTELVGKETPEATIAFGQTVYGGVLDVTSGKLHVTWESVDMGTLAWVKIGMGGGRSGFRATLPTMALTPAANVKINALCEGYEVKSGNDVYLGNVGISGWGVSTHDIAVYDDTLESGSGVDFQNAMDGITLAYELATPFDIDLTPVQISAIIGENNVSADCGNTAVKYKDTIQHYIDTRT